VAQDTQYVTHLAHFSFNLGPDLQLMTTPIIVPNKGSTCIGTDPCRNSNDHWCGNGASKSPCR
jgi:hypothetical protein